MINRSRIWHGQHWIWHSFLLGLKFRYHISCFGRLEMSQIRVNWRHNRHLHCGHRTQSSHSKVCQAWLSQCKREAGCWSELFSSWEVKCIQSCVAIKPHKAVLGWLRSLLKDMRLRSWDGCCVGGSRVYVTVASCCWDIMIMLSFICRNHWLEIVWGSLYVLPNHAPWIGALIITPISKELLLSYFFLQHQPRRKT